MLIMHIVKGSKNLESKNLKKHLSFLKFISWMQIIHLTTISLILISVLTYISIVFKGPKIFGLLSIWGSIFFTSYLFNIWFRLTLKFKMRKYILQDDNKKSYKFYYWMKIHIKWIFWFFLFLLYVSFIICYSTIFSTLSILYNWLFIFFSILIFASFLFYFFSFRNIDKSKLKFDIVKNKFINNFQFDFKVGIKGHLFFYFLAGLLWVLWLIGSFLWYYFSSK